MLIYGRVVRTPQLPQRPFANDGASRTIATMFRFGDLHPTTRRLLLTRGFRSVGQGALVVDFALYLHALHWSGTAIGLVLGAATLFGAAMSLLIGIASDRLRRKPFLLVYQVLMILASAAVLVSAQPVILVVAAIFGGFGRGASGAAGPFSPAEQAWLAEEIRADRRGVVYSLNAAIGFFGMALGALIAGGPALWRNWLPGPLAYRPLFALVGLAAVAGILLLARASERPRQAHPARGHQTQPPDSKRRRHENRMLMRLALINAFNGLSIGLTGPLISYWFALRFGVGPGAIGPVMAAAFAGTGVVSLLTGKLTQRIGIVASVVWERLLGLVLLAVLPLMPSYGLAALIYFLRSAFARGSTGAQQALAIGLVGDERRGLATSLNAASVQLPRSIGPGIAGYLLSLGEFALPFYVAAGLQGAYLILYNRAFRDFEDVP